LNHRVVQVQEAERERLAVELHDHITQLLCAILFRCQALVDELAARDGPSWREAKKLRDMLGETAQEVERISRNLRPGVLDQLGLTAVLHATGKEFAERTGVPVELAGGPLPGRLRPETELALFRILQEALKNVEQHARAKRVVVELTSLGDFVQLTIRDDGAGFDPKRPATSRKGKRALGLIGMRERAAYLGGIFTLKSARQRGTVISVRIPLPATLAS
jgi:signal transduction histidine kinase